MPSATGDARRELKTSIRLEKFQRDGSQIRLTRGRRFLVRHCKSIIDEMEVLRQNTGLENDAVERELRIAVNNIIAQDALVALVLEFEKQFPTTELSILREVYNGCWDARYGDRADLVIGVPHGVPHSDALISESLGEIAWDFVIAPDHPLAQQKQPLRSSDLRKYPAVYVRDTSLAFSPQHAWLLNTQKPLFVPGFGVAIALIEAGAGIGYVPRHMAQAAIAQGRLVARAVEEQKHATHLFLVYRPEKKGRVRQWCVDYVTQPEVRRRLCGEQ